MLPTWVRKSHRHQLNQLHQPIPIMGDKSPKANQKKSSQKQVKAGNASQAKQQAASAKAAAGKK
jgi:hypothetical protein